VRFYVFKPKNLGFSKLSQPWQYCI